MSVRSPRHAFISYASADRARALQVCESLEARGLLCWIAPRDLPPGVEYGEGLVEGIRSSRCLVLVLSAAANASPMVSREVERAVSSDKPIFPIRVEEVLPARSLEFFVSATQWIDAWEGSFLDHVEDLARELRSERSIQEAVDSLRRGRKKRALRRRLSGSTAFVLAIGLLTLVNSWMRGEDAPLAADSVLAQASKLGIDVDELSAADFRVQLGDHYGLQLSVDASDELLEMANMGMLELRLGTRPWTMLYLMTDGTLGYLLNEKDIRAEGPLELRLSPNDGRLDSKTYGPYRIDFDLTLELKRLRETRFASLVTDAEASNWLIGEPLGVWRFDAGFQFGHAGIVSSLSVGSRADALDFTWRIPVGTAQDSGALRAVVERPVDHTAFGLEGLAFLAPFRREPALFGRLEYVDGTVGTIRRFDRWSNGLLSLADFAELRFGQRSMIRFHKVLNIEHSQSEPPFSLSIQNLVTREVRELEILSNKVRSARLDSYYVQPGSKWDIAVPVDWTAVEARLDGEGKKPLARRAFHDTKSQVEWIPLPAVRDAAHASRPSAALYASIGERSQEQLNLTVDMPKGTVRVLAGLVGQHKQEVNLRPNRLCMAWDREWGENPTSTPLELLFQLEDGAEVGPVAYDVSSCADIVRSYWNPFAQRNRSQLLRVYRKESALSRDEHEFSSDLVRAQFDDSARIAWLQHDRTGVVCVPQSGGSSIQGWQAVDLVRVGDTPSSLTRSFPVEHDLDALFSSGPVPLGGLPSGSRIGAIELPLDTERVFVQFVLADGTETEPTELPIILLR